MSKTFLFAFCIAATLAAQDFPTFRVETRLVEVDIVVHRKGEPVADLTAADFTLFDRGKKQKIALFSVRRDSEVQAAPPLAPGVVTNRVTPLTDGAETPTPTVILLDTLNSLPADMAEVRRQLLLYLDRAPKNERFALYSLNKTLNRLHDFTADRDHLREIVNRWIASASLDMMTDSLVADLVASLPGGDPITTGMAQAAIKEMADAAILNRATSTAFALELIAKHLAGLPGRKKLVWITGAFPAFTSEQRSRLGSKQIEARNYSTFIDKATRALNLAQVAVYPIDSRRPCSPTCMQDPMLLRTGIDTMNRVAGATGGRAVYVTNDIAGAIEDSVRDSEITYRLGFYPASSALDGKDHDIKVQVARDGRDGVEVRYRKAYLAADSKGPSATARLALLRSAMESPLDATEIGLTAQLQGREILLTIDIRALQLSGEQTALVTIGTFFQNRPKLPADVKDLRLTFTDARLAEVLRDGYRIRLQVDERGVPGRLRLAVQDRSTGITGSVTIDIR